MCKNMRDFIEIENVEMYDYLATRENLENNIFKRYRQLKEKVSMIEARLNSSFNFEELGIFSPNRNSDPTFNKVKQLESANSFINTIDNVYETYKYQLSKDEIFIYKKIIEKKHTDEEIADMMNMCMSSFYIRKKSCILKVARWYDLEVYN